MSAARSDRPRRLARWAAGCAALGVLLFARALAAEPLGRLFFTPQERAQLEQQRHAPKSREQAAGSESVSVSGVVVRGGGRAVVWLNGKPVDAQGGAPAARVQRDAPASMDLRSQAGRQVRAKVGETVDLATGVRRSGIGGGRIEVSPAPGAK